MHVQTTSPGELTVHRGETVEVLDESAGSKWQVKNKFGASGYVPAQVVDHIHRKKPKGEQINSKYSETAPRYTNPLIMQTPFLP